jgi:hypothetical protein
MATNKVWLLRYIAGNPAMFSTVITADDQPKSRADALSGAAVIERNTGGAWRAWVEHTSTGERIYESPAEKSHQK